MDATLPLRTISAGDPVQHASRSVYRAAPLHFGRTGSNRYDAPDGTFGVLYLGFDLATVLMKSMFRNHRWHRRKRRAVSLIEVKNRIVRVIGITQDLIVADLHNLNQICLPLFGRSFALVRQSVYSGRIACAEGSGLNASVY